eukprot:gene6229-2847_t
MCLRRESIGPIMDGMFSKSTLATKLVNIPKLQMKTKNLLDDMHSWGFHRRLQATYSLNELSITKFDILDDLFDTATTAMPGRQSAYSGRRLSSYGGARQLASYGPTRQLAAYGSNSRQLAAYGTTRQLAAYGSNSRQLASYGTARQLAAYGRVGGTRRLVSYGRRLASYSRRLSSYGRALSSYGRSLSSYGRRSLSDSASGEQAGVKTLRGIVEGSAGSGVGVNQAAQWLAQDYDTHHARFGITSMFQNIVQNIRRLMRA